MLWGLKRVDRICLRGGKGPSQGEAILLILKSGLFPDHQRSSDGENEAQQVNPGGAVTEGEGVQCTWRAGAG